MGHRPGGRSSGGACDVLLACSVGQSLEWSTKGGEPAAASYVAGLLPDARPLQTEESPEIEDTEGGSQPADKSLINRRLSRHSQPCAAIAFLADGELAEQALNRASPLDREHKSYKRMRVNTNVLLAGPADAPATRLVSSITPGRVHPLRRSFSGTGSSHGSLGIVAGPSKRERSSRNLTGACGWERIHDHEVPWDFIGR